MPALGAAVAGQCTHLLILGPFVLKERGVLGLGSC